MTRSGQSTASSRRQPQATSRSVALADEMGMKAPTLFTTMYMHAAPQDAVPAPMPRTAAIGHFTEHKAGSMQDPATELPRIYILVLRQR